MGFVINHECTVRMFEGGVGCQDGVVGLYNSGGNLGSWVDCKLQLGLLSVINRKTLHKKGGESRASSTTERMEDQESLKSSTLISKLPDPVQNQIHNLLADGVVSSCIVVSSILLAGHKLFRVE